MAASASQIENSAIANRRVGFVGKFAGMNRRELKQLVRQHGGIVIDVIDATTDLVVIGEDSLPVEDFQIDDAGLAEAAAHGRIEVMTETQFWQSLGLVDPEHDARRLYTSAMLADLLQIPISTVRRWHRRGLIVPTHHVHKLAYFDFQEVASARKIAALISSGASPSAIESKLSKLTALFPELQRPLSQLSVIAEGRDILLRAGDGLIEPGGQKRFDFSAPETIDHVDDGQTVFAIEPVIVERQIGELQTRDDFLKLAIEFEDADDIESACEVYRSLMLAFGPSSDICFRLAENLFQIGELSAARERYYSAIELDGQFVEARASLGCLLVELGNPELAISAFLGALDHHAEYPDVLFHLARQLDEVDRPDEAESHWRNFLRLAPKSPWADEARHRLGISD